MLEVCRHADRDAGWDHPLLELERLVGRNTRTAVHGAVTEAITQCQPAVFNDGAAMRDTRKAYRRHSLINACIYGSCSSWAQVGFFCG